MKTSKDNKTGPVIVGGVGGSGTRVVTQILQELDFFIGNDLGNALDNRIFSLLFKRVNWRKKSDYKEIKTYLEIFERYMFGEKLSCSHNRQVLKILFDPKIKRKPYQIFGLIRFFLKKKGKVKKRWGWKEPNTHIYLESFLRYFKDMKYVHLVRHGLDMAFSENNKQLYTWGPYFGIDVPKEKNKLPLSQLDYWIVTNNKVRDVCKKNKDRCLLLNYDDLCSHPKKTLKKLLKFLEIEVDKPKLERLSKLPRLPSSIGRYKRHGDFFTEEQKKEVESFGFLVEYDSF